MVDNFLSPPRKSVLIAVDDSRASKEAFRWALANNVNPKDQLLLIHSYPAASKVPTAKDKFLRLDGEKVIAKFVSHAQELGFEDIAAHVRGGEPAHVIAHACSDLSPDLLILGSRLPSLDKKLHGVSHDAIHKVKCPVLMVKEGQPDVSDDGLRVLIAVDKTERSKRAFLWALENIVRGHEKVSLTIAHAVDVHKDDEEEKEDHIETANALLASYQQASKEQKVENVQTVVLYGEDSPSDKVAKHATQEGADIVVSASRNLGTVQRILKGSVSEGLLKRVPGSMLIFKGTAEALDSKRKVTIAVDNSVSSKHAFRWAMAYLVKRTDDLDVLHAFETSFPPSAKDAVLRDDAKALLSKFTTVVKKTKVDFTGVLRAGKPAESIVEFTQEENSGLLVMGSRGLNKMQRALGHSVSSHSIHHAKCPILVVKDPAITAETEKKYGKHDYDALSKALLADSPNGGIGDDLYNRKLIHVTVAVGDYDRCREMWTWFIQNMPTIDVRLTLLHVIKSEKARASSALVFEEYIAKCKEMHQEYNTQIIVGDKPREAIAKYVNENTPDLLVLATRGRGAVKRTLFGSKSDYVVNHVSTPVLVYKHGSGHASKVHDDEAVKIQTRSRLETKLGLPDEIKANLQIS